MTTYYVDGVAGNDANAGTSEGSGNAWATCQKAADTLAAGDIIWVKGNGNYVETVTITTPGTTSSHVKWEGYTTTTGDNGMATIAPTGADCIKGSGEHAYHWKNFRFTGSTGQGYDDSTADQLRFENCRSDNNSSYGFWVDDNCSFYKCQADSNSNIGFNVGSNTFLCGCISHTNSSGHQFSCTNALYYKSLAYGLNAGSAGMNSAGGTQHQSALGCTIDGENTATSNGIKLGSSLSINGGHMVDNIAYDCNEGLELNTAGGNMQIHANNLLNSNTTDTSGLTYEVDFVTSAPAFTDEAGDDYTLGSSSPAIDAGVQPGNR